MGYKRVTLGMRVMVVQMATYASSERDLFYKPEKSEDPVSRMKEIIDRKKYYSMNYKRLLVFTNLTILDYNYEYTK